ncbi:MAG: DUF547 domain-containing protein [Saprospiraceae bacterium]|nr:MAG: DUF547 domain-containing protein [Saprospiraceae bacterium]
MQNFTRWSIFASFIMTTLLLAASCKVSKYDSDSKPINHALWDTLLQEHVNEAGWVDYEGFIKDSVRMNKYLTLMGNNHPNDKNWSENEQKAYWINAYNAYTVKLIMDNYPVASIKDIKNGIPFVNTVWDIKFINIEDRTYDLNNIEHGILRPRYKDPRIHFAVNCASFSCPKLQNKAYVANKLEEQLDEAAREFLAEESRNKLTKDKIQLSKLFTWYKGDFTEKTSVIGFINQYAPIQVNENATIEYLDYDWNLNKQ